MGLKGRAPVTTRYRQFPAFCRRSIFSLGFPHSRDAVDKLQVYTVVVVVVVVMAVVIIAIVVVVVVVVVVSVVPTYFKYS